jgi:hypothetical protein
VLNIILAAVLLAILVSVLSWGVTSANDCLDCHSSSTSSTVADGTPIVYYTGSCAPTEYLAGGNFWWVAQWGGMLRAIMCSV